MVWGIGLLLWEVQDDHRYNSVFFEYPVKLLGSRRRPCTFGMLPARETRVDSLESGRGLESCLRVRTFTSHFKHENKFIQGVIMGSSTPQIDRTCNSLP